MKPLLLCPLVSLLALAASPLSGQAPPVSQPQLSPKAAYADAMQPLLTTRAQVANWSDAEIAALKVTVARAATACDARQPKELSGDPLVDLAKLCALGQRWNAVIESTTLYIAAADAPKPLLADAYAAQIDANLHLKNETAALTGARSMLAAVPYNALSAQTIDEVLTYTQFADTSDALALGALRQAPLLAAIHAAGQPAGTPAPASADTSTIQSLHELYDDGLLLASLQQLAGQTDDAHATLSTLDSALPTQLASDDAIPIAASRRRYALLGRPLPQLKPTAYLRSPDPLPQIPAANAITALLLFPDWCAQCVRMGRAFPPTVFTVAGHEAYLYGLLAETIPPDKTPTTDTFNPADSSLFLEQTPTVVVPVSDLDRLAVNGVPFLVITDARGMVRVAQSVDLTAIQPGNTVDTAIACVGAFWPMHLPSAQRSASAHLPALKRTPPPVQSLH